MKHGSGLLAAGTMTALVAFGSIAVGANIGILGNSPDSKLGSLSAADVSAASNAPLKSSSSVSVADQVSSVSAGPSTAHKFTIADAGTVELSSVSGRLRAHTVTPATGWTWNIAQRGDSEVRVTFSSGTTHLEFVGNLAADGTVTGSVQSGTTPAAGAGSPSSGGGSPPATVHHEREHDYEGGENDD